MDAGKTAIFSNLAYANSLPTHTSLQANSSVIPLSPTKNLRVVDVPGHPRIRGQFTEHLGDAKALAFVVDTNTISRNGAAVAEHLHLILHSLTSLPPSQAPPQLLILCNKTDLLGKTSSGSSPSALAVNRVRTILERELEKRRVSTAGGVAVEGLGEDEKDGGEAQGEMGGLECGTDGNAPFRFEEWEGGEVVFLGTSVKPDAGEKKQSEGDADGLAELREWLEENM